MIGFVRGTLLEVGENRCLIETHGIGFRINCSRNTLSHLEKNLKEGENRVELHTTLIHREDVLELYGFQDRSEQKLFELLISVSGIGPRQAMKILSSGRVEDIASAIVLQDDAFLRKLSGIGKKRAQQILFELKEKIHEVAEAGVPRKPVMKEAVSALMALGFSPSEAAESVKIAIDNLGESTDLSRIVEEALRTLAGKKGNL